MAQEMKHDPINHPAHYAGMPAEVECIDIARHLPYNLGCAVKYIWRAGKKDLAAYRQDLEKALWYLNDFAAYFKDDEKRRYATAKAVWGTAVPFLPVHLHAAILWIVNGEIEAAEYHVKKHLKEN